MLRLKNIKLAGFKSFVDPTTVPLPGNLTAVVGPNGCGKSNIIDAVRWVMGESSAKHLRGESLTDVIFNGSSARQPVGQASVELNFDNSDGSIGGEYASYSEIAIKRVVTRDGQSIYYLNNVRCRRKDITDIFLGTGLGPRSYSIIEQGTISRLIEAKPEELRVYLEEAAGISKYKERRRETELRIQHTRDNLARLTDLREELGKQLDHLQRQANAAERYKVLKQEERLLKAQLQGLRWQSLNGQLQEHDVEIKAQEVQLEVFIAEQRSVDANLEKQRAQHTESTDIFEEVQGRYYRLGAEIARLEQAIQHQRERRSQLEVDLAQAEEAFFEAKRHLEEDQQAADQLTTLLTSLKPDVDIASVAAEQAGTALTAAEQAMHDWQQQWDDFNRKAAEATQRAEVEQTRIQHLEQHLSITQQRIERLEQERGRFSLEQAQQEIELANQRIIELQTRKQNLQQQQLHLQEQLTLQRQINQGHTHDLDKARSELQSLRGRYSSLEALQQAALGKRSGAIMQWLEQHHLNELPRLAQGLRVTDGWERAVETALGSYLEAVCVEGMPAVSVLLDSLQEGTLTLFETTKSSSQEDITSNRAPTLLSKVQTPWSLSGLLSGIYIADTLAEALTLAAKLSAHESVITKEGIWLGKSWLRVARDADEKAGVLQRERELADLKDAIAHAMVLVAENESTLETGIANLQDLEAQRDALQQQLSEATTAYANVDTQIRVQQSKIEQTQQRLVQLENEITEQQTLQKQDVEQLNLARSIWQEAMQAMDKFADTRAELTHRRDTCRDTLEHARQHARTQQDHAHQLALRLQSTRTQLDTITQNRARMQKQLESFQERSAFLRKAHEETLMPIQELSQQLEEMLSRRLIVEEELTKAKQQLTHIDHEIQQLEKKRSQAEQSGLNVRNHLEHKRMEWQAWQVRCNTLQEQLLEAGYQLEQVLAEMPAEANEASWEEQVQKTHNRIERLGPINLAAIDEYATQSERKVYLDAQNQDLEEALQTLEEAIRKIDKETRTRFKETFDQVNNSFQTLFPRIFGGGNAYLELTGEDLLDTGVTVMARPPGKRNSTIHLLSGGEKALTAVALVFAIFQLNPAPFCMLDEVDAPLDDANIGRFCDLVKEMSQKIQFVFISHNKLAMEMAQHLTGVTMNEPGVSRLVAVDMEEAIAMAVA